MPTGWNLSHRQPTFDGIKHPTEALFVAARTAGDAQFVAAVHQGHFFEVASLSGEDVTTTHASAFRDEKAYTVVETARALTGLTRGPVQENQLSGSASPAVSVDSAVR